MERFEKLKKEIGGYGCTGRIRVENVLFAEGIKPYYTEDVVIAKAHATAYIFRNINKCVYENDMILGSYRGCYAKEVHPTLLELADRVRNSYVKNTFRHNADHFAPDYEYVLAHGIRGLLERIARSRENHKSDPKKLRFLNACEITTKGLSDMIYGYGVEAEKLGKTLEADICKRVATEPPSSFREALQLVWLIHLSFYYEGRDAMALGRVDQYLYPFYKKDLESGKIDVHEAAVLITGALYKLYELKQLNSSADGDVVNICIGGLDRAGNDAVNELSYAFLEAVKVCAIAGPNLSARISEKTPDEFLDKCLEVIGTGIGYPAIMNDEVNIAALLRCGYSLEDCRDYCMVGCIENFIPGRQPPWSDGLGPNQIKCLELALNNGRCMQTGLMLGIESGKAEQIDTMEKLLDAFKAQLAFGIAQGVRFYLNENTRFDPEKTVQPTISCFTTTCIERGLDVREGGALYPRVHGFGFKGFATLADSLAAIEKVVFEDKALTLAELRDVLIKDYEGYDDIRAKLLKAPKFGNGDEYADKYASWIVDLEYKELSKYKTPDGGAIYQGIASNIWNIHFGLQTAATPDGRKNGTPLSDAASPMRGMDKNGLTQAVLSVSTPDYTKAICGTVYNVKLTQDVCREDEKRALLRSIIRVYFGHGGQEMQFNCVSREMLIEAMEHPEEYSDMVVRVSGFSAFYTSLSKGVQKDILERTEHNG